MAATDPSLIVRVGANLDDLNHGLHDAQSSVDAFAVATGDILADAAEKIAGYLVDIAKALPELMLHGSDVADLEDNFRRLTAQVGLTSDALLQTLRTASHGTIDDFQLMKRVNQDLAAGLNLTDDQFGLLAKGAFALANATGVDTVHALDQMSDALVRGKAKGVEALTGQIDLKAAEDQYAKSLGVSADALSDQGKLYADRMAILGAVGSATDRLGEQTDGLDEKVAQAKIAWTNFLDELGKTLATSPVLIQAIDGIQQIIQETFSVDKQHLIKAIGYAIDTLTIGVVEFARGTVDAATEIGEAWHAIGVVINTVDNWILQVEKSFLKVVEVGLQVKSWLEPWNDFSGAIGEVKNKITDLDGAIDQNKQDIADHEAAEAKWAVRGQELSDKLAGLSLKLQQQRDATMQAGDAAADATPKVDGLGRAHQDATGHVKAATDALLDEQSVLNEIARTTYDLMIERSKAATAQATADAKKRNDAVIAELNATKDLTAAQGLTITGERDWAKTLEGSAAALTIYQQKMDALHASKLEGISQTAQEQQITNDYTQALYDEAKAQDAVAESAAKISPPIQDANQAVGAMSNTLVLGIDNLEQLNAALSDFYDQFAGNSAGTPGVGSYGTPGPQGMPRMATGPRMDWYGLGLGGSISGRAAGGSVDSGTPYVVGEQGPELFIPARSGAVVPSAGSVTNNFYITQPLGTPQAIAAAVGAAQMTSLRARGERFR